MAGFRSIRAFFHEVAIHLGLRTCPWAEAVSADLSQATGRDGWRVSVRWDKTVEAYWQERRGFMVSRGHFMRIRVAARAGSADTVVTGHYKPLLLDMASMGAVCAEHKHETSRRSGAELTQQERQWVETLRAHLH